MKDLSQCKFENSKYRAVLSDIIALESSRVHLDTPFFLPRYNDIKQLLDEVEHDIVTYQNRGLCYQTSVLIIHDIMRKPNSIIVLLYVFKQFANENF